MGYYARRTRAAIWMSVANLIVGVALGVGVIIYLVSTRSYSATLFSPDQFTPLDLVGLGLNVLVAIGVWIAVSKTKYVEKAGPARLFGYLAIALLPLVVSVVLAMALRSTTIQPFYIPSGAMQPTLNVGDYVVVSKSSYGYSRFSAAPFDGLFPAGRWRAREPARGDIVVFRPVPEPGRDFVKRVVGMPGDRVQMIAGVLHINGAPVTREVLGEQVFLTEDGEFTAVRIRETLPNGVSYVTLERGDTELDNTPVVEVPEGHYFMMGDDRDNSADGRVPSVVGLVPFDHFVGRVDHIIRPE